MKTTATLPIVAATILLAACSDPVSVLDRSLAADGPSFAQGTPAALARPFKGTLEGTQTVTPLTPPLASVAVSVSGNATMMGRFTLELPHTVNFATQSAQGTATFVAANGDQLIASFTGAAQVGPIVSIVEQATITGGTGRFEGASGSFTISREFNPAAGTTTGSFEGTVSAPGW
jgi:hypothetical protein